MKLACALLMTLAACGTAEGTVLVLRDPDAAVVVDAALDAADDAPDAAEDARADVDAADATGVGVCRTASGQDGFNDTFAGAELDPARWLVAHAAVRFAGKGSAGGLVRDNVSVEGGALVLRVRGDRYEGPVRGVDQAGAPLRSGKRSGAAVATRDLFHSGTYLISGLLSAPAGVEVALWVMRDDDAEGGLDIATPGLDGDRPSSSYVRARSRDEQGESVQQLLLDSAIDGQRARSLRFDWYTTATPGVRFWTDDMERWPTDQHLPSRGAARMWIVAWAPDDVPLDFDTAEIRIENTFIRPFANSGDRCEDGELSGPGLGTP